MTSIMQQMIADFESSVEGIESVVEFTSPILNAGQVNVFQATYPVWTKAQAADEPAAELIPIRMALDLSQARIVITAARLFEQLRGSAGTTLDDGLVAATHFHQVDAEHEADLVHLQAEFNIAVVGAKALIEEEGEFVPHFIYTLSNGVAGQIAEHIRSREFELYVRTPFMHIDQRNRLAELHTELVAKGFDADDRQLGDDSRRRYVWALSAATPAGVESNRELILARQRSGLELTTLRLSSGRQPANWREGRPEFVDFGYHLHDNIRGAAAMLATGQSLSVATSLSTALTGIDRTSNLTRNPAGNPLRATVSALNWDASVSDEMVAQAFTAKYSVVPATVTDAMRAEFASGVARAPLEFPFLRRGNANANAEAAPARAAAVADEPF